MRSTQTRWINAIEMIRSFITQHGDRVRTTESGAWRDLDALGRQMREDGKTQAAATRAAHAGVVRKNELRAELHFHLARIVATVPLIPEQARLWYRIELPARGVSHSGLLVAAEAIAKAVGPMAPALIATGLPTDFMEALRGVIADLEQAESSRTNQRCKRVAATRALEVSVGRSRQQFAVVNLLMRLELKDDVALLAEWDAVSRICGKGARGAAPGPPARPACPLPETMVTDAGGPATTVAVNVTGGSPATEAADDSGLAWFRLSVGRRASSRRRG